MRSLAMRTTFVGLVGGLLPCHLAWAEPRPDDPDPEEPASTSKSSSDLVGTGYLALLNLGVAGTFTEEAAATVSVGASGGANLSQEPPEVVTGAARLMRLTMDWHLGGGGAGFDGALLVDVARGFRWPAQGHGIAFRAGGRGQLQGNQDYFFSALHFPHADLGYQYLAPHVVVELSGRASLFWDGRFHVDGSKSNQERMVAWGALLDVGVHPFVFMTQLLQTGRVTNLETRLCVWANRLWIACARGDYFGAGWQSPGFERSALVTALSVGVFPFGY